MSLLAAGSVLLSESPHQDGCSPGAKDTMDVRFGLYWNNRSLWFQRLHLQRGQYMQAVSGCAPQLCVVLPGGLWPGGGQFFPM